MINSCIDYKVLGNSSILCELQYSPMQLLLVYKHLLLHDPNRVLPLCVMSC